MPKISRKTLEDHRLIDLVQARHVIYDKNDRLYTSKHHVRDAWTEIAIEMDSTAMACQKRWRYLRDYFVRQLHISQQSPTSNSVAARTKNKSMWSLFERLKFLTPFSSPRRGRPRVNGHNSLVDVRQEHQNKDATNSDNSLSSTSTQPASSFDLNYINLLQKQLANHRRSSNTMIENNCSGESSDIYMIVDVDQNDNRDRANTEEEHDHVVSDVREDVPTFKLPHPEHPGGAITSLEAVSSASEANSKRSHNSEIYDELLDILKSRRSETEYDEHEHFFKSLLGTVRKIDDQFVMSLRTDIMQIVAKYLYVSQQLEEGLQRQRDEPSQTVVIETDQLNWRRNLCKYNEI